MENHPIPQDITGFQFKLIGSMTVRQFVYLAVVVLIGWFISFLLPIPHIISWPISIVIVTIGIIFTFVPVDGRPMDTMFINLFRAMLSPTKYIYGKDGGDITKTQKQTVSEKQIPQVIPLPAPHVPVQAPNIPVMQTIELNQISAQPVQQIQPIQAPVPAPAQVAPTPNQPSADELARAAQEKAQQDQLDQEQKAKVEAAEKKIDAETAILEKQIEASKTLEQTAPAVNQDAADQKIAELEKMLAEATRQKEELEREVLKINSKLEDHSTPPVIPAQPTSQPNPPAPQATQEPRVKQVAPNQTKAAGVLSMPEAPNLITGIVKDPRGNPLQNVLVEVKDEEDNPVRAFKTNGLGQFASATSVSNGKYFLSFEDPKEENKFDIVQIEATGHPIMPIEVTSVDKREELRRELFN